MHFVILARWRKKLTREMVEETSKLMEGSTKEGAKIIGQYWTFGRWDAVVIAEAPDEKVAMRELLKFGDLASTETLVALPAEEAAKLVQ